MSLKKNLGMTFNPLTAVSAYLRKTEGLRKTIHKKSTVSSKISKNTSKCKELKVLIVYEV